MVDTMFESNSFGNGTAPTETISRYMNPALEIPILLIIIILGVVGNLFIIGAVLVEKQLRNMGVAFIINLAVSDLVVTAWYLPQVLSNVIDNYRNSLRNAPWFCSITGFMVSWCCQVSMMTLMVIALGRYIKLTKNKFYRQWCGRKLTSLIIAFIWIETFFVALPLIIGWEGSGTLLGFDTDIVSCMWIDTRAHGYSLFLVVIAIFIPLFVTILCYVQIYRHVKKTRSPPRREISPSRYRRSYDPTKENVQVSINCESEYSSTAIDTATTIRTHHARHNSINSHKVACSKRAEERERSFLLALAVVVFFFVLFWTPYAICVILNSTGILVPVLADRACAWLALSNSAINSLIYGALNPNFRRGYIKMFELIQTFFICRRDTISSRKSCLKTCRMKVKSNSLAESQEYKQYSVTFN